MIESFQPVDYVLCGLTLVMATTGLFRGFSGTLAFGLATAAAIFTATFGWTYSTSFTKVLWMRAAGTLVGVLLTFGLIRFLVRKLVGGLLAQPSDAFFGFLIGASFGILLVAAWAHSGIYLEYSTLVSKMAFYVR